MVTTHSPTLASDIRLNNLALLEGGKGFPLAEGYTRLTPSDYLFLERFLDATKANLFFARAVLIVEGDAENILLPVIARLVNRDLQEYGVSVVNVGGVGLGRYARIFMREDEASDGAIEIPVACITDLDVMPNMAPQIIGKIKLGEDIPPLSGSKRQWRIKSDLGPEGIEARRKNRKEKASGQRVETFVANEWTLEYDLAFHGLSKMVWGAANLALAEDALLSGKRKKADVLAAATVEWKLLDQGFDTETLSTHVYALFERDGTSKAVAAQYLAAELEASVESGSLTPAGLRESAAPVRPLRDCTRYGAIRAYTRRDASTRQRGRRMSGRWMPREIAIAEIGWAADLMGLGVDAFNPIGGDSNRFDAIRNMETADFEACPGSGKTTLLVAKLAILANRWTHLRQGICVLSHTNAARNEIGSRLSASPAGTALLRYPHFVGTIHSFVNEFLAIPWLQSKANPIRATDNQIALRRRILSLEWKWRRAMEQRHLSDYALVYTQPDYTGGDKGDLSTTTPMYQALVAASRASSEAGYFCYDEMFVWANELIARYASVADILRARFPIVFIDEAQDNSELQSALLQKLFCTGANPSRRQRFGDSNQAIYANVKMSGATTDQFPSGTRFDLPRSYRFPQSIADRRSRHLASCRRL